MSLSGWAAWIFAAVSSLHWKSVCSSKIIREHEAKLYFCFPHHREAAFVHKLIHTVFRGKRKSAGWGGGGVKSEEQREMEWKLGWYVPLCSSAGTRIKAGSLSLSEERPPSLFSAPLTSLITYLPPPCVFYLPLPSCFLHFRHLAVTEHLEQVDSAGDRRRNSLSPSFISLPGTQSESRAQEETGGSFVCSFVHNLLSDSHRPPRPSPLTRSFTAMEIRIQICFIGVTAAGGCLHQGTR